MKPIKLLTSTCRYCQYYKPEGRRGGGCQLLGAPVQGNWKACSFALPPFAPSWESLQDAWSLPKTTPVMASDLNNCALTAVEETTSCLPCEQAKVEALVI